MGEVWVIYDQTERIYGLDENFAPRYMYAMTFTLDLKTCFKVTAHPLHKDSLEAKYEPDWAEGK